MIVSGFDREMPDLTYFVGTVSDHTLTVNDGEPVSLRASGIAAARCASATSSAGSERNKNWV